MGVQIGPAPVQLIQYQGVPTTTSAVLGNQLEQVENLLLSRVHLLTQDAGRRFRMQLPQIGMLQGEERDDDLWHAVACNPTAGLVAETMEVRQGTAAGEADA